MHTLVKSVRALALISTFVALPASAQVVSLSFSGSGTSGQSRISGSGTGTLNPGGGAALSFQGRSSDDNCTNYLEFSFTIQAANGSDSIIAFFQAPVPPGAGETVSSFNLTGSLNVTGGAGAYSGKGGSGNATLSVQINAKNSFSYSMTGTLNMGGSMTPAASVSPSGIVPVFSDDAIVQPGSWISIYGKGLANDTSVWSGDFPTSLGGVTVRINGNLGYLWFVSPGQINVQVPDDTKNGCVPVVITTPNGTVTTSVELEGVSPSFSLLGNYVAAVIPTPNGKGAYGGGTYDIAGPGTLSFPSRPVKRGETVELFGVGFGYVRDAVQAGKAFAGANPTVNRVHVLLGNAQGNFIEVPVSFSGLVGAGLYQINITVPQNAPTGDDLIQAQVEGLNGTPGAGTSQRLNVYLSVQ